MHMAVKRANGKHVYCEIAEIDLLTSRTSLRRGKRERRTEADGSDLRDQRGSQDARSIKTGFSLTGTLHPLLNWYVLVDVRFGEGGSREVSGL